MIIKIITFSLFLSKNIDTANDDAFDKVRQKEKLKTKGEKLLENK